MKVNIDDTLNILGEKWTPVEYKTVPWNNHKVHIRLYRILDWYVEIDHFDDTFDLWSISATKHHINLNTYEKDDQIGWPKYILRSAVAINELEHEIEEIVKGNCYV